MRDQKLLLLPGLLLSHRRRLGLAQLVVALESGLSQTVYCAIERGRRGNLQMETVHRIGKALSLKREDVSELEWAVEHDRLVSEVARGSAADSGPIVSSALKAAHRLTSSATAGARSYLDQLVAAQNELTVAEARNTEPSKDREASMP